MTDHDIVFVADPCFPGGSSSSLAYEIKAASRAGLRIALRPVRTQRLGRRRIPNPKITAALAETGTPVLPRNLNVSCRLALYCHPYLLDEPLAGNPMLVPDHVGLIAHHPLVDRWGKPQYSADRAIQLVQDLYGKDLKILPVSETVRKSFWGSEAADSVSTCTWHNLIDIDEWPRAARGTLGGAFRIGRHARPDLLKWPSPATARVIYPEDPAFEFHMLGVSGNIRKAFDPWPMNWFAAPFDDHAPPKFLATLDAYSYFHSESWIEAFGYNILEAMAAGLPVVLPPHFRESFGTAAIYAQPQDVSAVYHKLATDREFADRASQSSLDFVNQNHGLDTYGARFEELVGPSPQTEPYPTPAATHGPIPERILAVTSNGVGLGHLSRQLAIADAMPLGFQTIFFTLSRAAKFASDSGYVTEYRAFHRQVSADINRWNKWFATELTEALEFYRPKALVFDGNMPYQGLLNAMGGVSDLTRIWVRRGMWRHPNETALKRGKAFDLVIEPSEIGKIQGPAFENHDTDPVLPTPPILSVRPENALSRETARRLLGLDQDAKIALLQLGAGSNFDMDPTRELALSTLLGDPNWHVVELISPVRLTAVTRQNERHRLVSVFPFATYLKAFDFAVSACGYNSYHENISAGLPTVFVPNTAPEMDLQETRADFAERCGWGLSARSGDTYGLTYALRRMMDRPEDRQDMRMRMQSIKHEFNGSDVAARAIAFAARTITAERR
jgi:hypothetical protein